MQWANTLKRKAPLNTMTTRAITLESHRPEAKKARTEKVIEINDSINWISISQAALAMTMPPAGSDFNMIKNFLNQRPDLPSVLSTPVAQSKMAQLTLTDWRLSKCESGKAERALPHVGKPLLGKLKSKISDQARFKLLANYTHTIRTHFTHSVKGNIDLKELKDSLLLLLRSI